MRETNLQKFGIEKADLTAALIVLISASATEYYINQELPSMKTMAIYTVLGFVISKFGRTTIDGMTDMLV